MENRLKRFIVGIFLFAITSFGYALPNNFSLSIEPIYKLENGTLHEFVFMFDSNSKSEVKLSQLDWPISNISCLGGCIKGGWKFINLGISYLAAIPQKTGNMEDYDWQDYVTSGSGITQKNFWNNPNMCTNKSISETKLNESNNLSIYISFDIEPVQNLYITPMLGTEFTNYKFSAKNGYGWYGDTGHTKLSYAVPYTDPEAIKKDKGSLCGIDYDRENLDVFIGSAIKYNLKNRFIFSLDGKLSVYSQVQSIDFHHANMEGTSGVYYLDVMNGYFRKFSIGTTFEAELWNHLSGYLNFNYSQLNNIKGNTYISHNKHFYKENIALSKSQCSEEIFSVCTGVKWNF